MDSILDDSEPVDVSIPSINVDARPDDTFKILIATDIHLGVNEKDPIRGDDSFITFEEILLTAKEKDVDFILLGGDLFHDSKPSQSCYVKAISLIREHTMGDKPINMVFVSDSKEVLHNSVIGEVNYQDPNQNVSFPIFSIHGNHDDPSGFGRTSALDVLSANGQLNYFGVCKDLSCITLKPILLRKGRSKLAIYGISHIRDERLSRLMNSGQIEYEKPPNFNSWFKILVLHQNRVARAGTRHIQESLIPDFIDVVLWGHEHECLITPQKTTENDKNFYIIQPGSPVATSLCEGEAVEKRIGVLNVCIKNFQLDEIPLKTVRPMIFHTESVAKWPVNTKASKNKFAEMTSKFVNSRLLPKAEAMLTGHPQQPTLPLIRLRLEVDETCNRFNEIRFGQQGYTNVVANPADMITFKTAFKTRERQHNELIDAADLEDLLDTTEMKAEALAPRFFELDEAKGKQLSILSAVTMGEAVTNFITKEDKSALRAMINKHIQEARDFIKNQEDLSYDAGVITEIINRFKSTRTSITEEEEAESARRYLDSDKRFETTTVVFDKLGMDKMAETIASSRNEKKNVNSSAAGDHEMSPGSDEEILFEEPVPKRGRGRGRGSARKTSTTATSRGSRGRGSSFRASGKTSSSSSSVSTSSTLQTTLNFRSLRRLSAAEPEDDWSDMKIASPRKKAKMNYDEDSD